MKREDMAVRISDRVQAIAAAGGDQRSFKQAILDEIRRQVPFDWHVWVSTDPETEVGSSPLADVPFAPQQLPRLIGLKYATSTNRWTGVDRPAVGLAIATGGNLGESLIWRDLLQQHGVVDIASIVFRDSFGCWGFLDLWRTARAPFSADEMANLGGFVEPVTYSLRRALASTFDEAATLVGRDGPVVLMLSSELEVEAQTPETQKYLERLLPDGSVMAAVPAGAYNVAAQLLAREAGIDDHPPWARVSLPGGPWLTLRASRLDVHVGGKREGIAVTIEPATPLERLSLFNRVFGLTAREVELLGHLRDGADTRQVAERMFVTELTVQDHLKAVFRKTGTHNRRTLLVRALGQ